MTLGPKRFTKSIVIVPDDTAIAALEGNIKVGDTSKRLEVYLDSAARTMVSEDQAQTLTNKSLSDTTTLFISAGDATKTMDVDLSGATTSTKTTLAASQTTDRTLSLPDADDTLVGRDTTDTLTNKTLTSPTLTTPVTTVNDDEFTIQDDGDATKKLQFQLSSITTGTTRTLTAPDADETIVGRATTDTLTNKTIDGDNNTISNLAHGAEVDNPTTGVHGVTGTVVGTSDAQTLTNKTIDGDNNTISNLAHGAEVDDPSTGVHGVTGAVVGTTDAQTLTNKTIDADNSTITNLAHGAEVDDPSSGVHGVTGSVVGTTDSQTLTSKDYDGGTASNTSRVTIPKASKATLDGLTRKEGTVVYANDQSTFYGDNGTTLQKIGSGGGGLDVYHTEDFEVTKASDFTSSNDSTFGTTGTAFAGTLADETTSPISSLSSLKYTQAAGSLDDWFKSPAITIDDKQKGNTSGVTLYFTYDGDPGDIDLVVYDETNSTVLTSSSDEFTTQSNPTRFATSISIPSTTTSLSYGCHVKSLSSGAVLILDDIEFSTDPFVIQNLTSRSYAAGAGNGGGTFTDSVTNIDFTETSDSNGAFDGTTYTVQGIDSVLKINGNIATTGSANFLVGVFVNGSLLKYHHDNAETSGTRKVTFILTPADVSVGDSITLRIANFGGTLSNDTSLHWIAFEENYDSPALITPAKLPRTYSEANGDFTVTGTNWTTVRASSVPYLTGSGNWRLKFNITGTVSVATASLTLTMSGVTFESTPGNNVAVALSSGTGGIDQRLAHVLNSTGDISLSLGATDTAFRVSGDVELDSKPTWADDVSSNFLAAIPEDLGVKPALYYQSSGQSLVDLIELKLNFGTVETDQDGLVTNPATDWKYIAPKDGVYDINAGMLLLAVPMQTGDVSYLRARINGGATKYINLNRYTATLTTNYNLEGSLKVILSKGDEVEIFGYQNNTPASTVSTNPNDTYVSITREQTPVSFGGDIREEEESLTSISSGDFTAGGITFYRRGKQVTMRIDDTITHASINTANSAVGLIPTWARPPSDMNNIYTFDANFVYIARVRADGQLTFIYRDWAGTATNRTNAGGKFSYTYLVD